MNPAFLIKRSDNSYVITYSLVDDNSAVINLTNATVQFNAGNDTQIVVSKPAVITNALSGEVTVTLLVADTLFSGLYNAEFVVTFQDGTVLSYPRSGYISLNIQRNVDPTQLSMLPDGMSPLEIINARGGYSDLNTRLTAIAGATPLEVVNARNGYVDLNSRLGNTDTLLAENTSDLVSRLLNVKYPFGTSVPAAKGDNVTDDTLAITGAINYLNGLGGGTLYLPAGTYICSPISIPQHVKIKGAGEYLTYLQLKNGSNADFITIDQGQASGIHDLTIDGNYTNQTAGNGILIKNSARTGFDNSRNLKIEQLHIRNCKENGIKVVAPNVWIFQIRFVKIDACQQYGIWNNATDNFFYAVDIYNCQQGAVYENGANTHYVGGKWYVNGQGNAQTAGSLYVYNAARVTFADVEIQESYGHSAVISGSQSVSLVNMTFDGNGYNPNAVWPYTPYGDGLQIINNSKYVQVISGVFSSSQPGRQRRAVYVDSTCANVTIQHQSKDQAQTSQYDTTEVQLIGNSAPVRSLPFTGGGITGQSVPTPVFQLIGTPTSPSFASQGLILQNGNKLDFHTAGPYIFNPNLWSVEFTLQFIAMGSSGGDIFNIGWSNGDYVRLTVSASAYGYSNTLYLESKINGVVNTTIAPFASFTTGVSYKIGISRNAYSIKWTYNSTVVGSTPVTNSDQTASSITTFYIRDVGGFNWYASGLRISKDARNIFELQNPVQVDGVTTYYLPLVSDINNSEGTMIKPTLVSSLPTADVTQRGKMVRVEGNATTADLVYICLQSATGTFSWKQIISG